MSRYRPSGGQQPRNGNGYPSYDSYQSYGPPPPSPQQWNDGRNSDRYLPEQRGDHGFRGPFSDLRRQQTQDYGRRDNRDQRDDIRPPQGDFNFRVERPAGVEGSYESYRPSGRGDRGDRFDSYRPQQPPHGNAGRHNRGGYQGSNPRRGGARAPYRPPKAADRAILHQKHDEEAEVMLGDRTGKARYRDVDDLSDDADAAMDISGADSASDTAEPANKRVRLTSNTSNLDQPPKWSNPDPYTALPPPDETTRKKVDVVQLIRKARVEPESKTSASKEAADFISCDFSDEESHIPKHQASNSLAVSNAPTGPRAGLSALPPRPALSHQSKINTPLDGPKSNTTQVHDLNSSSSKFPPVKKSVDLTPSTSLGNRKRTHDDQIKLPHALLPKVNKMPVGGAIVPIWRPRKDEDPCPWAENDHSEDPIPAVRLHKELIDFHEYVRPRDFEHRMRQEMVDNLNALVKRKWSDATVLAFGSFMSDLYLPTADMDLVICSRRFLNGGKPVFATKNHIFALRSFLQGFKVAWENQFECITGAKVPLLKYCDLGTGLKVDISFENTDGVRAIQTFLKWKEMYPAMPILVSVIKHFLCMRGMNEPVNGGIGGFSVICLVVNLLNQLPEVQSRTMVPEHHLGQILLQFFHYYGKEFRYETVAIRMEPPGQVNKNDVDSLVYKNMDRLSIIDPNNPRNDISGGSKNFPSISDNFSKAYDTLQQRMSELSRTERKVHGYNTILATLFAGDYSTFRTQREYLRSLDRGAGLPSLSHKGSY
ncbi:uncharacterized protein BCR38DRAFT_347391 [Pseudomassariella vexata]|uniref:polynucleotide adenylyltransferase n=1 Tax=Pseudomassariella vexata TaxID=1141098 RepID=A0A1Y2DQ43_9PEZI|nr:uncharacterized protein BCR38DRAFT_347391 [Pseudomassariella vexata]ORY61408.1 hypothetical protein BCR38DRAFT_347391 [Pseudomassariella vexata]